MELKQKLVAGPRWWPDTGTDWPTDRRSRVLATKQTKKTPWPFVRERIIPTERTPLVDEI
jgi:hypothetical protein